MRSFAFALAYWTLSIGYGLTAAFAALAPGRSATTWIIRRYVKRMVQAMRVLAGIKLEVRGRDRLPTGAFIIASKHQSWGDGFAVYDQFEDLAFVTGDHLEKFPLLGTVLRKLGAIVVNNCGGREARDALKHRSADAHAAGRKILIYPKAIWPRWARSSAIAPASGTCTATSTCRSCRWRPTWACSGLRRISGRRRAWLRSSSWTPS